MSKWPHGFDKSWSVLSWWSERSAYGTAPTVVHTPWLAELPTAMHTVVTYKESRWLHCLRCVGAPLRMGLGKTLGDHGSLADAECGAPLWKLSGLIVPWRGLCRAGRWGAQLDVHLRVSIYDTMCFFASWFLHNTDAYANETCALYTHTCNCPGIWEMAVMLAPIPTRECNLRILCHLHIWFREVTKTPARCADL